MPNGLPPGWRGVVPVLAKRSGDLLGADTSPRVAAASAASAAAAKTAAVGKAPGVPWMRGGMAGWKGEEEVVEDCGTGSMPSFQPGTSISTGRRSNAAGQLLPTRSPT